MIFITINFDDNYYKESINTTKKINKKINLEEKINKLKEKYNNSDIVGILKIYNTDFQMPIAQTINNNYYLNHTLTHEKSSMGAIFLDYRINVDDSRKLLIYGHSSSINNFPFNFLESYYNKNYYKKHKYISLTTSKEEKIYKIYSVYIETSDFSYMNVDFLDNDDYLKHIISLKDKSLYDIDIKLKEDDEILILQTCSNHIDYSNYSKKYLLIISRRIK